ncbi:hypothetical protein BD309DRAFT_992326 [Dichomitus squalens]|nr:hypothetical protein BD309DRAFT_992326 [Dichomitus squalens]
MPERSYSELANWSGSVSSASGTVHNLDIVKFPSPSSSRLGTASSPNPDIHTTFGHRDSRTQVPLSSVTASTSKTGVAMDGTRSPAGERPQDPAIEAVMNSDVSEKTKDATRQRLSAEHPSYLPMGVAAERVPNGSGHPPEAPSSPSHLQPNSISPRKPPSKAAHPPRRSFQTDSGGLTGPPVGDDDDTNSLMDADGETDHESSVSVYPIQSNMGSSSTTTNTDTRDSTEATAVMRTSPVNRRQKRASKGSYNGQFMDAAQKYHVALSPSAQPSAAGLSPSTAPSGAYSQSQAKLMSAGGRISSSRRRRRSSSFTSPEIPLSALASSSRPAKKRRPNLAYVEVPPLPSGRRRASYRPASEIRTLQDQMRHAPSDEEEAGADYAAGLGWALNTAAASNGRQVSASPAKSGRQSVRRRVTEPVAQEMSTSVRSDRAMSVTVPKKRGRPPKVVKQRADEAEVETRPSRRAKAKGKDRAYEADSEPADSDGEDERRLAGQDEEQAEDDSGHVLADEMDAEPAPAADALEEFFPSVRIDIDKYPLAADGVLHVAFRRLLIGSKSLHWPPRSEQSVTSSLPQAPPVLEPASKVDATATSFPARKKPSISSAVPLRSSSIAMSQSSSSVTPTISSVTKVRQPIKPLPRRHVSKQHTAHLAHDANTPPTAHASTNTEAASPDSPAKRPRLRTSRTSLTLMAPVQTPLDSSHASSMSQLSPPRSSAVVSQSTSTVASQPTVAAPHFSPTPSQPSPTRPSALPQPFPGFLRTDSQQSIDFGASFADCDMFSISSTAVGPSSSPHPLPSQQQFGSQPSSIGFRTLQEILEYVEDNGLQTEFPQTGSEVGNELRQATLQLEKAQALALPSPSIISGGEFLAQSGLGTLEECGSVYPWMLEGIGQLSADAQAGYSSGFIDPSLLGGSGPNASLQLEAHPPLLSPQTSQESGPVAGPSRVPEGRRQPSLEGYSRTRSRSSSRTGSPTTPWESAPNGPQRQFSVLSRDLPAVYKEGKRMRRPTERAISMRHALEITDESEDEFLPSTPDKKRSVPGRERGRGKGQDAGKVQAKKGAGKGKGKEKAIEMTTDESMSIRQLAEEPTFCHQCRNKTLRDKMRCTSIRASGQRCGLRYCQRCIELRYPDVSFDSYAVHFVCPRCQNICNCTACARQRNEPYISLRVGKLPKAGPALMKEAERIPTPNRISRQQVPSPPPSKLDLVPGQFFGIIYGLQGERMGQGYIADIPRVVIEQQTNATATTNDARAPVRRKQPRQFGKPIAYIGKRRVPFVLLDPTKHQPHLPSADTAKFQDPHEHDSVVEIGQSAISPTPLEMLQVVKPGQSIEKAPSGPPLPPRRTYIGDRSALDKGTYVSMDELIKRALRAEEDGSLSDLPFVDDREGVTDVAPPVSAQHSALDVQCAIALAFHRLQASPKDQAKVAAADAVRT